MRSVNDPAELTIEEAAALLRARALSPVELVDACLSRIDAIEPALNAFITVTASDAREAARAAERQIAAGTYRGPLHGIPVAVKDLFATRGVRTTAGSQILRDHVPSFDASVVARLREAGAVVVGKLGMHEFAYGISSVNPHWGDVRNPWDVTKIPGGSCGGSAVAVVTREASPDLLERVEAGPRGLRVGVPARWAWDECDPSVARSVRDAIETLADAG